MIRSSNRSWPFIKKPLGCLRSLAWGSRMCFRSSVSSQILKGNVWVDEPCAFFWGEVYSFLQIFKNVYDQKLRISTLDITICLQRPTLLTLVIQLLSFSFLLHLQWHLVFVYFILGTPKTAFFLSLFSLLCHPIGFLVFQRHDLEQKIGIEWLYWPALELALGIGATL